MKQDRTTRYQKDSLTLSGTVMLGTGVMIGAGIFALTGQMAQMTGSLFQPPQSLFLLVPILISKSLTLTRRLAVLQCTCIRHTEIVYRLDLMPC